jgi:hypothetical protein
VKASERGHQVTSQIQVGEKVVFTATARKGQSGEVTKIHGPKTVELRMDRGFMLWHVKIANIAATRGGK